MIFRCPVPGICANGLVVCSMAPSSLKSPSKFSVSKLRKSRKAAKRRAVLIPRTREAAGKEGVLFARLREKSPVAFPP